MTTLVWIGEGRVPPWSLGSVVTAARTPLGVVEALRSLRDARSDVLLWDARLGAPDQSAVRALAPTPGHVLHAGVRLGLGQLPSWLDHVAPSWMLACPLPADRELSSWRVSLQACLIRGSVLVHLVEPTVEFDSVTAMGLHAGLLWHRQGALIRYVPSLVGRDAAVRWSKEGLSLADEARFVRLGWGPRWVAWAACRAAARVSPRVGAIAAAVVASTAARPVEAPPPIPWPPAPPIPVGARVTVLIPTLERYPYLRKLLEGLSQQTVRPTQILVMDQTPAADRDDGLTRDFPALPIEHVFLDEAGQCSSRNLGLERAKGEYVFFADDDTEIEPDLLARHVANLQRPGVEVSSGITHEVGALPVREATLRTSDVFPMGNTMIRRSLLERTGLLDLAYERGVRADGDFGMRALLAGAIMVLDPGIDVLHLRAPRGGLRAHGERVVTFASSRRQLAHRHLPARTEIYLAKRYFTPHQVHEMLVLRATGTLSRHGGTAGRAAKAALGLWLWRDTWRKIRIAEAEADAMLKKFPQIPRLPALEATAR